MVGSRLSATALIVAMLLPGAALASDDDRDVQTRVVNVAYLDLSTGAGMDGLIRKLRSTIDDMCGGDSDCRDQAWLSADWQVARETSRDIWQRRIAMERASDWRQYRRGRDRPGPIGYPRRQLPPPPPSLPRVAYAPVPSELVSKTTSTTVTTTKTTTVTLVYRTPPPDYRATWTPR